MTSPISPFITREAGQSLRDSLNANISDVMTKTGADKSKVISAMSASVAGMMNTGNDPTSRTVASMENLLIDPSTGQLDQNFADFMSALTRKLELSSNQLNINEQNLDMFEKRIAKILDRPDEHKFEIGSAAYDSGRGDGGYISYRPTDEEYPDDTHNFFVELGESQFNLKVTFAKNNPGDEKYSSITNIRLGGINFDATGIRNLNRGQKFVQFLINKYNESSTTN